MRKENIFMHVYGGISLLGIGLTVWMVKTTSENDQLFNLSLIAFFLILIAFLLLNRVLNKLEEKTENIVELNEKIANLEGELTRCKNISDYLAGQLGQISPLPRKSTHNE